MLPSQFSVPPEQFVQAPFVQVCVCAVHADDEPHVPFD
jgi:hypothetical protein